MAARHGALLLALALLQQLGGAGSVVCPGLDVNPSCPCYNFDDGVFVECPAATLVLLADVVRAVGGPIQSLSVYDLDRAVARLGADFLPDGAVVRHLQVSQSNLEEVSDDAFFGLKPDLESLSLISGKLTEIPQKAFNGLLKLIALDLESNEIGDLPSYSFYGLNLIKLNLKGNRILKVSEYGFAGLEGTLAELDMSENRLRYFPIIALRRLDRLKTLKLAWNEIKEIVDDGYSRLEALLYLDISSNNFESIVEECFKPTPSVRTLSLYYNVIESVHPNAFGSLVDLESIDLSHNKIVFLDSSTFQANKKLRSIDLSHNHIHYISGLFARLPELKELFLSENNILEIPLDSFTDSSNIVVIYLQQNAIRQIHADSLSTLINLSQLHLSSNFVPLIPRGLFFHNQNLSSLSLDNNLINDLDPGTFDKTNNLKEIRLHNNHLENVYRGVFDPLPSLIELHLQNNFISSIDVGSFRTLQSLQHINLQGNIIAELRDVFAHESSSLVSIQLDSNSISSLYNSSLKGQTSVQIMWLSHNKLKRLDRALFRDLLMIQRVYLNNNSIDFIEDKTFESMRSLKFLDLSINRLKSVSVTTFAELYDLEELYLAQNGIESLEAKAFTNLKKLRVLDLSHNKLSTLKEDVFQERLPIRLLNLMNCTIVEIEKGAFRGLNNLNELNLENNRLETRYLQHLDIPGLRVLKLKNNNFSDDFENSLDGLPSLQVLSMDICNISNLPEYVFSKNKNLVKIDLSDNNIFSIKPKIFDNLNILKELKLSGNRFSRIPYLCFLNVSSLETLTFASNEIVALEANKLNGLSSLRDLDLSRNRVSLLSGFETANLTQLSSIDFSYNQLTDLPINFFRNSATLQRVDLAENKFKQMPTSALSDVTLPKLNWLNLTGNPLERIHDIEVKRSYPNLEEIHITNTNLSIISSKDLDYFPMLQHVYLGCNKISRISPGAFGNLPNLLTLDLRINLLEFLPQERLQGLTQLRVLNLTQNKLKDLEEFPSDLKSLQILDLSRNNIGRITKAVFEHLENLVELYLFGNWISSVSEEAFRPLKKLRSLDLSRNYLENIPLGAVRPLETQIRSLRTEENPLSCNCDSHELWEWLTDHKKLVDSPTFPSLKCEQPPELRGMVFLSLEPEQFCKQPLVLKLAIQDIQPFSVLVSWQSRNHSGLHGYQVVYYSVDTLKEIRGKVLDRFSRTTLLSKLFPGSQYLICVLALGNWLYRVPEAVDTRLELHKGDDQSDDSSEIYADTILPLLVDSQTSKCTEVTTLGHSGNIPGSLGSTTDRTVGTESILTRRLGLIIGCCMGFVVFIVLVSVLGYLKLKKQRSAVKTDQPMPPEYISYRHFSIQSGEAHGGHPHFITSMNTTSLN